MFFRHFILISLTLITFNSFSIAIDANNSVDSDDSFSWFFIKFGDSTDYASATDNLNEKDFTTKQYEAMLNAVESKNADPRLVLGLINTLYKDIYLNPSNTKYDKLKARLFKKETLKFVAENGVGLFNFLTFAQLKDDTLLEYALRDCSWTQDNREVSSTYYIKSDLWKKLPSSLVQKEAYNLLPCTLDIRTFINENNFTRLPSFIINYLKTFDRSESYLKSRWLEHGIEIFRHLPNHIKKDKKVIQAFLDSRIVILDLVSEDLKKDLKFVNENLDIEIENNKLLEFKTRASITATKLFPLNLEVIDKAVMATGHAENLEFVDQKIRGKIENLIKWCAVEPNAYKYAAEPALSNINVIIACTKMNTEYFSFAPLSVRGNISVIKKLFEVDHSYFNYAEEPALSDMSLIRKLLTQNPYSVLTLKGINSLNPDVIKISLENSIKDKQCWIPEKLNATKNQILDFIKINTYCFELVKAEFYDDTFHKILLSRKIKFNYLFNVPNKYLQDPQILNLIIPIELDSNYLKQKSIEEIQSVIPIEAIIEYINKFGLNKFSSIYEKAIGIDYTSEPTYDEVTGEYQNDQTFNVLQKSIVSSKFSKKLIELVKLKKESCKNLIQFFKVAHAFQENINYEKDVLSHSKCLQ